MRMNLILVILYLCGMMLIWSLFLNFEMVWSCNKGELIFCMVGVLSNVGFLLDVLCNVLKLRDCEWDFGWEISFGKFVFLLLMGLFGLIGLIKIGMGVGGNWRWLGLVFEFYVCFDLFENCDVLL